MGLNAPCIGKCSPRWTDGETEAQRGPAACLQLHSVGHLGPDPMPVEVNGKSLPITLDQVLGEEVRLLHVTA